VKNRRIGIIGRHDDPEVQLLKARIEDLGAEAIVIDFWHYPRFTQSEISMDRVLYDGINLTSLDAFYLRQLGYFSPLPHKEFTKEEWDAYYEKFNEFIANEREVMSYRESLIQMLETIRPVINPYFCAFYHKLKLYQYWKLNRAGLPVPDFVAGNDYSELKRFASANQTVGKPMMGGYVRLLDERILESERRMLRKRPIIAQRRIPGRMLRCFVLADRILGTCELVHKPDETDARLGIVAMERFELAPEFEMTALKAAQTLGMIFAGVDLVLDEATNSIYVLECNPAPLYRSFEAQTGLPISHELAGYLVNEAG